MMTITIALRDGTELKHCGIYSDGVHNEEPIQDEETIRQMFAKVPWGRKTIYFQNMLLQGNFDSSNINGYTIHQ